MNDRFDVQLGVARPIEPGPAPRAAAPDAGPPPRREPVEYRNRGIPVYLLPPLLILFAALGIVSYQNLTTPLPLKPLARQVQGETGLAPRAAEENRAPAPVAETVTVVPATRAAQPEARPFVPMELPALKPAIDVVETSAEKPAVPSARAMSKPLTTPASLFEHETVDGLRPVADGALKRARATAPEPPLTTPTSEP